MKNLRLFLLAILVIFASCNTTKTKTETPPKYVFYFIGDGFGMAHAQIAEKFLQETQGDSAKLTMNSFPDLALYSTFCDNRFITGSAAAGTALSTGEKTTVNTIGMADDKKRSLKTIAEKFRDNGYKVGIVSSVSIDHATPAAFYAHQPSRNMYYNISLELSKSGFNYFAGGDFKHPEGDGEINDKDLASNIGLTDGSTVSNKPNSIEIAKKRGYTFARTREEFNNLKKGQDKVILFPNRLEGGHSMYFALDQNKDDINLVDFTSKGIELLDNSKGFFMMVEGGKIDWAAHANCISTVVKDVLQFDKAIAEAVKFYNKHPKETLIVVCGDHETGGLAMGSNTLHYETKYSLLKNQTISYEKFAEKVRTLKKETKGKATFKTGMALVTKYFGLGDESKDLKLSTKEVNELKAAFKYSMTNKKPQDKKAYYAIYGGYEPLTVAACHIMAEKIGASWASFSHTATHLPVRAIGNGSLSFKGLMDNTDIPNRMEAAAQLK